MLRRTPRREQTPRALRLGDRRVEVVAVLDQWLAPDHRYFNVQADDGYLNIIRHDVSTGVRELTMTARSG